MQVILDTNILLGALISSHGPPFLIFQAWRAKRFELVTSLSQLEEIRRVSRYPKFKNGLPAHRVGTMVRNMQGALVLDDLPVLPAGVGAADPDDDFLLQMALKSKAGYLVTGDRRAGLLDMQTMAATQIVTARWFCHSVLRE